MPAGRTPPELELKRGWLSGLRAWEVYVRGTKKRVAYILRETWGKKWAVFYEGDDLYADLLYDFDTREQVLNSVAKWLKEQNERSP